ncbi:hypothetical protein EB796_014143 [Bugula neritina]|uniref:INO80 complex subunit B-like conserved region domain-containing protein n=1 Tax=Bugula neritina TaxID=10212 RepID=A0A7J7JQ27_BUGNE|nr:hypothetical protein EB796_014143 [Bugula neritina]
MAELGITGKRVRKKPKYLRDEEEEEESKAKQVKQKKVKKEKDKDKQKSKLKKESKKRTGESTKPGIKLKIKFSKKSPSGSHASTPRDIDDSTVSSMAGTDDGSDEVDVEGDAPSRQDSSSVLCGEDESEPEDYANSDAEMDVAGSAAAAADAAVTNDDTSDEEREWLQAVESGDIEEYEKKKSEKNPALLTARQRRLLHGGEDSLLELPNAMAGKPLTEEQINSRKQKAIQRRQQALEKSEKAKKQTVDRLLKKSDTAISKNKARSKTLGGQLPHMRYSITKEKTTLSIPPSMHFPLQPAKISAPPKPIKCGVSGCQNIKKYNCSKTKIPLCSLQCYKKNLLKRVR